jgi:hypothetical protein
VANGGRRFDFAVSQQLAMPTTITIEAPPDFFLGPDRIAIQEASAILLRNIEIPHSKRYRISTTAVRLTAADVVQHRKPQKSRMGKQY